MFGRMTLLKVVPLFLLAYACVPLQFSEKTFWLKVAGLPIGYLPFLGLLLFVFIKEIISLSIKKGQVPVNKTLVIFCSFLVYITIQFPLILLKNPSLDIVDFLTDYAMFMFYGIVVLFGCMLYLCRRNNAWELINDELTFFIKIMAVICVIAIIRFVWLDQAVIGDYFFNIFNPLRYRLFEVLFLIFFAAVTLGWYYSSSEQRYLVYFALFSLCILLAGSRTGYIGYLVILVYFLARGGFKLIFSKTTLICLIALIIGIYIGGDKIMKRVDRTGEVSNFFWLDLEGAHRAHHDEKRLGLLLGSLELAKENPIIGIGLGKDNYIKRFPYGFQERYVHIVARPHNFYLYILSATGIIGLLIFLFFFSYLLRYGYMAAKLNYMSPAIKERVWHLVLANFVILILKLGYEFETEPFLYLFWGYSISYFYIIHSHYRNTITVINKNYLAKVA
jgi:O-antigen ligase